MKNETKKPVDLKDELVSAVKDVKENKHQDLSKENLGNEPEEQPAGDKQNPYRLEGYDDKRPESKEIEKGWTIDSNTSRGPQDLGGEADPNS